MERPRNNFKLLPSVISLLGLALLCAGDGPSQEYKVKAAFIYNFARFIEWPADAFASDQSPFVIAVIGTDPFNGGLEQAVAGKLVGNRRVEIRHFDSVDKIGACQILFVPTTDDDTEAGIVQKINNNHVLTIGESENFGTRGGSLRFFTDKMAWRSSNSPEADVDLHDHQRRGAARRLHGVHGVRLLHLPCVHGD
jgi:hypothetical protein